MIFLTDNTGWNILHYKSYKLPTVVRSPLAAETHALADPADCSFSLVQHDLEKILGKRIKITLLTDANSLFDVIAKGSATSEKRLMIYSRLLDRRMTQR